MITRKLLAADEADQQCQKKILRLKKQNVTQKNVSKPFMVEASRSHNALQSGRSDHGMTTYNSQKHELDNKKK